MTHQPPTPLAPLTSIKLKLGLLVAVSVVVATLVGTLGRASGVPVWLSIPVTVGLALAVTQLLAVGMISPLREMTAAARRMATGDYAVRVTTASNDEVGALARTFNQMATDLADVDRQRRELVANVSHELRTPLAGLRASLENLVDGVDGPDSAAAALAGAERMSDLVEDLLDLARVDAGKAPLTPRPVTVADLLSEVAAETRSPDRDVAVEVDVTPDDLVVHADPGRLRQLVTNLLDNAVRHSPAAGTVRIRATTSGERYRLEVSDAGPGIAPADRDRVFEPFGTLRSTEGGGGTGLGLAIARWVSDLHGGSIRFVDPEPGATGALVRVDLPLRPPDRPTDVPGDPVPTTTPTPPAAPTAAPTAANAGIVAAPSLLDDLFGRFWPDRAPARLAVLVSAAAVGVLAAIVLPFRDVGLGTFLVLLAAGGAVLAASTRRRDPFTLTCAGLCVLLAATTAVRDADWIIVLCLLAGAVLTACGVGGGRSITGFALSAIAVPLSGLRGLPWLGRTLGLLTGIGNGAALLRTAVLSLLALIVFGALFSSADALLARWVTALLPDLSAESIVLRAFVTVAVGGVVLATAYLGLNPPDVDRLATDPAPVTRRFEWLVPVAMVNAVFAAFLIAQATVVFGGHDHLQETTGLTYAEYVHQGFGQLTVATALTLLVVWAAARKAPRSTATDRAWLRGALGLLCVQTLVVVASALHRVDLYQEAYGFTELRLLVVLFESWVGLLVLALLVGGVVLRARWLPRFALLSGTVALLALAAINPDAWIAERNLDRYAETGKVDWPHLRGLSDDAVPTLAERLPNDVERCALGGRSTSRDDWLEWNLGRSRAAGHLPEPTDASPLRPSDCSATPD